MIVVGYIWFNLCSTIKVSVEYILQSVTEVLEEVLKDEEMMQERSLPKGCKKSDIPPVLL